MHFMTFLQKLFKMGMFCHLCGAKNESDSRFCCDCGESLADNNQVESKEAEPDTSEIDGVIFTNTKALADKFEISQNVIHDYISSYVTSLNEANGFQYGLIDVKDFLSPQQPWSSHVEFLENTIKDNQIEYSYLHLFILGGGDIIPMPVIPLPDGLGEEDLDSDIPYAYLIKDDVGFEHYPGILFTSHYMLVGRLPFAADATYKSLKNYFERSLENANGVRLTKGFGIENIARKPLTSFVLEPAYKKGLFSRLSDATCGDRYVYNELHSSMPNHVDANLERESGIAQNDCFDYSADLFHILLHGDGTPANSQFFGELWHNNKRVRCPIALTTGHIANAKKTNVFVTSACYGGRFINYKSKDSMLLSALNNKTLIYFGASRTSISCCNISKDNTLVGVSPQTAAKPDDLRLNQRLANVFMKSLLDDQIISCGMAMQLARFATILPDDSERIDMSALYDALIYNLYGDPSLFCVTRGNEKETMVQAHIYKPLSDFEKKVGSDLNFFVEDIQPDSDSLLNKVRGMVDANLQKIREDVDKYLYANYNVDPRLLNGIFRVKYKDGTQMFRFVYKEDTEGFPLIHIVQTDSKGKIMSIAVND